MVCKISLDSVSDEQRSISAGQVAGCRSCAQAGLALANVVVRKRRPRRTAPNDWTDFKMNSQSRCHCDRSSALSSPRDVCEVKYSCNQPGCGRSPRVEISHQEKFSLATWGRKQPRRTSAVAATGQEACDNRYRPWRQARLLHCFVLSLSSSGCVVAE